MSCESFHISIEGDWTLSLDGDAPENPTAADVEAVLPSTVERLISDWNLQPRVVVS